MTALRSDMVSWNWPGRWREEWVVAVLARNSGACSMNSAPLARSGCSACYWLGAGLLAGFLAARISPGLWPIG